MIIVWVIRSNAGAADEYLELIIDFLRLAARGWSSHEGQRRLRPEVPSRAQGETCVRRLGSCCTAGVERVKRRETEEERTGATSHLASFSIGRGLDTRPRRSLASFFFPMAVTDAVDGSRTLICIAPAAVESAQNPATPQLARKNENRPPFECFSRFRVDFLGE